MVAFLLHHYRQSLPSRALNLLFGSMFALSAFSFVFTALPYFSS
jgi:hypothetical protein